MSQKNTEQKQEEFSNLQGDVETTCALNGEHFLETGSPLPNTVVHDVENQHQESYGEMKMNEVIRDIKTLPRTELKDKYPLTYSRWKNMKSRKKKGAIIDPRFEDFTDFLGYMNPVPNEDYTLDRVDNNDPTYSPDHCRWANKYTQNSNKGNNVYVTYDGENHTIAQWAAITNQKPNTLYKRKKEGWTDEEIVTGIREKIEADPWSKTPWPKGKELNWERGYQESVCRGKELLRLDFLIEISEKRVQELGHQHQMSIENGDIVSEVKLTDKAYWDSLLMNAKELKSQRERRKRFITRNSNKGKQDPTEAALFDLVNPSPMTFTDISTISRTKSITDHKES